MIFFFSSRRRHTRYWRDWSSDVCSSDLGTSWAGTFKDGAKIDEGTYLLVSGQRLADGSVLARNTIFSVKAGETTHVDLQIRETTDGVKVIGNFDSKSKITKDGKAVSILSQTGRDRKSVV